MVDFTDLGLQSYQDKVYRTLVDLGAASAQEIAEQSDVPRGRIYDVLASLESEGLVRRHDATDPRQYLAVEPETAIERLLTKRETELTQQRQHYEQSADELAATLSTPAPVDGRIWTTVIGMDKSIDLLRERLKTAQSEICLVVSTVREDLDWLQEREDELDTIFSSVPEDVPVRLLIAGEMIAELSRRTEILSHGLFTDTPTIASRSTTDVFVSLDLIDDQEVCLDLPDPFEPTSRVGMVNIRDEVLARQLKVRFEHTWQDATTIH